MTRQWRRDPLPGLMAVVAMALGIGLTAGMLAILDGLLLRGLPFDGAERLYDISNRRAASDTFAAGGMAVSLHDYLDLRADQQSFEDLVPYYSGTVNLSDGAQPERHDGLWTTASFFSTLRVAPAMGRALHEADSAAGAAPVLVISHRLWQRRFGADPAILGRSVRANSVSATVVGVMPEGFHFPSIQDVWQPVPTYAERDRGDDRGPRVRILARLKDGVSPVGAAEELSGPGERLAECFPNLNEGLGIAVRPFMDSVVDRQTRRVVGLMLAAVLFVLLLACFNVSHLLIGRAALRSRELAIRTALGGRRRHAVAVTLVESATIAALGAALGLAFAYGGVRLFDRAMQSTAPPTWIEFYLSPGVFAWVALCTVSAALISAFVPAWQTSSLHVRSALVDGSRGSGFRMGRAGRAMVVAQVAVSTALSVAAGLAVRGVVEAQTYAHAFDGEHLLSARLGLFEGDYPEDADLLDFYDRWRRSFGQRPDVERAAVGTVLPAEQQIGADMRPFERPGEHYADPGTRPLSRWVAISPEYFEVLGVEILEGRPFLEGDSGAAPSVAIVNRSFAAREWPGSSPLGRTVDFWMGEAEEAADPDAGQVRVVGVVPDLRFASFDNEDDQYGVYVPVAQFPSRFAWAIVRGRGDPKTLVEPLHRAVLDLDPNLPLYYVRTMDEVLDEAVYMPKVITSLFTLFGLASLIMACAGMYGLMAFAVSRRTREMGIRLALGADGPCLVRLILGQGLRQVLLGLSLGLPVGAALGFFLSSVFFQVGPLDPQTFLTVPLLLTIASLAACWLPAQRASRVDPVRVLAVD